MTPPDRSTLDYAGPRPRKPPMSGHEVVRVVTSLILLALTVAVGAAVGLALLVLVTAGGRGVGNSLPSPTTPSSPR
jgi:hypothetical protein